MLEFLLAVLAGQGDREDARQPVQPQQQLLGPDALAAEDTEVEHRVHLAADAHRNGDVRAGADPLPRRNVHAGLRRKLVQARIRDGFTRRAVATVHGQ